MAVIINIIHLFCCDCFLSGWYSKGIVFVRVGFKFKQFKVQSYIESFYGTALPHVLTFFEASAKIKAMCSLEWPVFLHPNLDRPSL